MREYSRSFDHGTYGTIPSSAMEEMENGTSSKKNHKTTLSDGTSRTYSFQSATRNNERPLVIVKGDDYWNIGGRGRGPIDAERPGAPSDEKGKNGVCLILAYTVINSVMCIPFLYGYASVIFNHPVFQPHINALCKLVIFSSFVHQMCFTACSTLPFAIGQVQDAGLIFLSAMANTIAEGVLNDGGSPSEALSTAIVLLGCSTAALGVVLVVMGRFRLADAVSYLPFPVVGGYLAFIGYFCVEAGVALCISKSMEGIRGWQQVLDTKSLALAIPGLLAGWGFAWIARVCKNDVALPAAMAFVAGAFYVVVWWSGMGMEGAREAGLLGRSTPPTGVAEVMGMVQFSEVRWDMARECVSTWAGMVFVVSFSSCLDVAAISMDMGEALEVNTELVTVGISNLISGLSCGFTGSYIFSQTLFTYRTGCHSRMVGFLVAFSFLAVAISKVNALEIVPLFFLGAALIFIGFDLMYEWMVEVRHKLLLSEYVIVLITFTSMLLVDINTGMIIGIIVAVLDYVISNSREINSLTRVTRRSLASWNPQERKILEEHGYAVHRPAVLTFDVRGTVFFGSSVQLLTRICDEAGLTATPTDKLEMSLANPRPSRRHSSPAMPAKDRAGLQQGGEGGKLLQKDHPDFVVINLTSVPNLDATAARGCFLQLAKMCAKRNIVLIVCGANQRVDWMLRSHDVAYSHDEEQRVKKTMSPSGGTILSSSDDKGKVLLFRTANEALEFCEILVIEKFDSEKFIRRSDSGLSLNGLAAATDPASVLSHVLGLAPDNAQSLALDRVFATDQYHREVTADAGRSVFAKGERADAFYVVLCGKVGVCVDCVGDDRRRRRHNDENVVFSGETGGEVKNRVAAVPPSHGDIKNYYKTGGIFGYVDYILERPRTFTTVSAEDGTVVAELDRSRLQRLQFDHPDLAAIVEKALLQISVLELYNTDPL